MLEHLTDLDHELAVGSCPRSPEDVDQLVDTIGVRALVCLQTDEDLRARGLRWPVMWQLYTARRVAAQRVPITDFAPKELRRRLDDAVDAITAFTAAGRKVYVHCTAGLNRSPSAVIAYLMRAREMSLSDAREWLLARHRAEPYGDALTRWAKKRKLAL